MHRTFDYTGAIRAVVEDIVRHLSCLRHVDVSTILFSFARARKRGRYGTYAKIVPLRFRDGTFTERRSDGTTLKTPRWTFRGKPYLYIIYIYLPRFHDLALREKILTLVHELYHVSPSCDGSLRTFPGGRYHGNSEEEYDARLEPLVDEYLASRGRSGVLDFLRVPTARLERELGKLRGLWVRLPEIDVCLER